MDGIEATHEILDYEEDEEVAHVPIVALTANALKGDRERFLGEGMDEYITKPIETTELLYVLNKFLGHKASAKSDEPVKKETPPTSQAKEVEEVSVPIVDIEDEPTIELETQEEKKILIAKKFLLARRVLAKVFDNIGQDYEILSDVNTLQETLASGDYDLLFADANLITESINNDYKDIAIIASTDTNSPQEVAVTLGENISNTASKEEIENIITKYRG